MKKIAFLSFGHWTASQQSETQSAADTLLQSIDLAVETERLGMDGAYFRVHHFARQLASPFPLLAAVGARTSKIEIGTAVIDMRYENPHYMAEDAGAADLIAGGRLQLGISRGSLEQVIEGWRYFGYTPREGEDDADMGRRHAKEFFELLRGKGFAQPNPRPMFPYLRFGLRPCHVDLEDRVRPPHDERDFGPMISYDPIPFIKGMGYTEREASFLYLVAVHSGYFLRRQFDSFIDRNSGAIAQHFLTMARQLGHIATFDFGQQRHVYHLRHKNFYTLLEDPDSQNRRRKSDAEIKLRLMALDYVLLHLTEEFLSSREEKVQCFTKELGIPSKNLPVSGHHSERPFADRILISYDKEPKAARFIFMDEGTRSLSRFERFLSDYQGLFTTLKKFEVVYSSDAARNFTVAKRLFEKIFPQSRAENSHALYPEGAERLVAYFQVRAQYDAETGGLSLENFLLLREGNLLYIEPDHEKMYQEWRVKPFTADVIRHRVQSKTASMSFRTELLGLAYPIFNYRHLPKKPPAIHSIDRPPTRPAPEALTP